MKMHRVDGQLEQTVAQAVALEEHGGRLRPPTPLQCRRHLCHLLYRTQNLPAQFR